jgi:dihydrofolate reductase
MISIIVATDKNGAIGKDNALLWHLPNDLKRFKVITSGHPVIMGRRTYESIGKPLPNRRNVIISNNKNYKADGCEVVHSLKEAIELCKGSDIYIIGGGTIYKEAMYIADKLYLTLVDVELEADTYLENFHLDQWIVEHSEEHLADEKHQYNYQFIDYLRRQ